MYRTDFWTLWEKATVRCFKRTACILSMVKQITSPGGMHETSARAWCTGKTQRDWVEREVGGGSGWGTHVNPWLIHVNVWQNPLKCCEVINLQLIKINEKKNCGATPRKPDLKETHAPQCSPLNPKENQPWVFIGRTDAEPEAEAQIFWPPDPKSWLIWKDPDAGEDWGHEEKGETEDEMVKYHHWLNGHEFEQTLGDSGEQRSLVCYSPWDRKKLDTT